MNRRSFFNRVAAIASVLGLYKSYPVYSYDWTKGISDDPWIKKVGRLPVGRYTPDGKQIHKVTLDGKDISDLRICRLRTGRNGYVEYTPDDIWLTEIYDTWTGRVWVIDDPNRPKMQVRIPHSPDPRYIERTCIKRLTGLVEYVYII